MPFVAAFHKVYSFTHDRFHNNNDRLAFSNKRFGFFQPKQYCVYIITLHLKNMPVKCCKFCVEVVELKVAATVGKGIVDPGIVDNYVIFGALIGAIAWDLITWYGGIPPAACPGAARRR